MKIGNKITEALPGITGESPIQKVILRHGPEMVVGQTD